MHVAEAPATREELCSALAAAGEAGTPVRFRGGGTKLGWPPAAPPETRELSTAGLTQIVEHNAGDLTAVLEAGVPLAEAQALFAKAGQRLALDPPDGGATIGGATSNSNITLFPSARNTAWFPEIIFDVVTLFTLPLISSCVGLKEMTSSGDVL